MVYHLLIGVSGVMLMLSLWVGLMRLGAGQAQGSDEATVGGCEAASLGCRGCAPTRASPEKGETG